MRLSFMFFGILFYAIAFAQQDKVTFSNDDSIIGEVKGLKQGVLTIETDYSDSDFTIEWGGIKSIQTETYFLITLSDGRRFNGKISSNNDAINIITEEEGTISVPAYQIVFLGVGG